MPFLLLLFLTLACLPDEWPQPWGPFASPGRAALLTWAGVVAVATGARALALVVRRRLIFSPSERESALRLYGRGRTYHLFALLGVYALSLYLFGWGWVVQLVAGKGVSEAVGAEILVLLPFFTALVLSWGSFYDAERAIHATSPARQRAEGDDPDAAGADDAGDDWFRTRGAYVAFHARQNLAMVLVPLLLLVLMKGLRRVVPEGDGDAGYAASFLSMALGLTAFLFMPWVLRLVMGMRPLPAGPLRDRLEATARRLHFRYGDILVWDTRGSVVNAMVAGLVPWVRYVMLSDRMLEELTPEEIEAVFGHEAGHVRHSHMIYYLGFLMLSVALLGMLWVYLGHFLPALNEGSTAVQTLPLATMLGAYIFVVFGFLSRRCERQADVYGCRAVSCGSAACDGHGEDVALVGGGKGLCPTGIRTFVNALEKVARLNGISRDRPGRLQSWLHSTIALRVEFLQGVLADPTLERRFQRRVGLVKWGLLLGLGAVLGALVGSGLLQPPAETPPEEAAQVGGETL